MDVLEEDGHHVFHLQEEDADLLVVVAPLHVELDDYFERAHRNCVPQIRYRYIHGTKEDSLEAYLR